MTFPTSVIKLDIQKDLLRGPVNCFAGKHGLMLQYVLSVGPKLALNKTKSLSRNEFGVDKVMNH